ncbi:MAG: serine hydrolase, partial [Nocardioidaceae bacterium]|nr:serine hydrolase [Nocardioidaceae bacterium]
DGTVPGRTSLDPVADNATDGKVGLAWMITSGTGQSSDDHEVIWHNGMTGGFATYLGLQPDADRAVVVLSGTALGVDEAGLDLLNGGNR